jgi:hypothetical protein
VIRDYRWSMDPVVPKCTRIGQERPGAPPWHWCDELCPAAPGQPCKPPDGERWRPRGERTGFRPGSAVANYRLLRGALPRAGELTEVQERYLRWLAGLDIETTEAVASLFQFAGKGGGK